MQVEEFQNPDLDSARKSAKLGLLTLLIFVLFGVYALKLFSMQVIRGKQYRSQSERNSNAITVIEAQRGEIFDRKATSPLVINTDSFAVDLIPGEIPRDDYDTVATKLAEYLGIAKSAIDNKVPSTPKARANDFRRLEIKTNVPLSIISNIAENITDLPGVSWRNRPIRTYLNTGSISHVIGYVGGITTEEYTLMHNDGYYANDIIGKAGIERQYDKLLQGVRGREIRIRDARGRILDREPIVEPPQMGRSLVLTIDTDIQRLAEQALGERVGAVVVLKPASGEILAMVSYPYFDSNIFSSDNFAREYQRLENSPNNPLMNRAVNAQYPPASTFKTIMTTALLSEKTYPADKPIDCTGRIEYGDRYFRCHLRSGHGYLDLKNALAQSCDVYFWVVGRDYLGVDRISSYATEFGFGQSLQIDLPSQKEGFVPTAQWKERRLHQKWLGGDTMNMSIGQGYTLVTPMHVADMMAMVCNSGVIYKPHLLKEIRDPATNEVIEEIEPEVMLRSTVEPSVWRQVQTDLRYMITNGTATYPMGNRYVQIAGKTGTAEVNGYGEGHWHSWMVAYAPYNAPVEDQIVVATIVEAVNNWEWWAPYATNIIIQGICANQTYEQALKALHFETIQQQLGRRE